MSERTTQDLRFELINFNFGRKSFFYFQMNFINRLQLAAQVAMGKKAITMQGVTDASGNINPFAIWADNGKLSPSKAMELYLAWSYACIRAIAEEIAGLNFELYKVKGKGESVEYERIFNHELLDLLEAVNDYQTGYELRYLTAAHLEAVGNAYWFLEGVEKSGDIPKAIYPLNAGNVKVIVDRSVFPGKITKYIYTEKGKEHKFDPYKILHIKYPDPNNMFEGIGTIQAIAGWIEADNFATEFNRRFFMNGAWLGVILESEAITPAQMELLRESFEMVHKGVNNAHRAVVLPKSTKVAKDHSGMKDMDFPNLMSAMMNKILAGFRVPRTVLGITDDVNRANAEATNYVFALRTIKPKMQMVCNYLNEFLVPLFGNDLYLTFTDPVPQNRLERIEEMKAAVAGQAVMSRDEAREEYFGLGAIENGDKVMGTFNEVPIGAPKPKSYKPNRLASKNLKAIKSRGARNAEVRKSISETLAEKIAKELKNETEKINEIKKQKGVSLAGMLDEDFEPVYKAFVGRVGKYENQYKNNLQKFNGKQLETVLKNLESAIKDINPKKLFDKDKEIAALIDLELPIAINLFTEEATEAAGLMGLDFGGLTKETKDAIKRAVSLMSESYNETTLSYLEEKLTQGINDGLGINELKSLVEGIYEFSDKQRAEMVARTETFRTANEASRNAWKESGVVKTIKWFTAADERTCEFCGPLHGEIVGIDEKFFEKGDTLEGENGNKLKIDYDDIGNPPAHPQCRCYIRPEEISIE